MKKNIRACMLLMASLFVFSSYTFKTKEDSKEKGVERNAIKLVKIGLANDVEFALAVADGGKLQVQLAELALKKGNSQHVKKFAEAVLSEHSKANTELRKLAAQKSISIPVALSNKNQRKYNELSKKKEKVFDEAYAEAMVKDHMDIVEAFKEEAANGKDAELKKWAKEKIPVLEHHLAMSRNLEKSVKNN
jgi:putative membrane protein